MLQTELEDEFCRCFLHLHRPLSAKQHVFRLLVRQMQLLFAENEVDSLGLARIQGDTGKVREALQRVSLLSSLFINKFRHPNQRRLHKQQNALISLTTSSVGHLHIHINGQSGSESRIPGLTNLHRVSERGVGQAITERMNHRAIKEPIGSSRESSFLHGQSPLCFSYLFRTHIHVEEVQVRHVIVIIHRVHKSAAYFLRLPTLLYSDSRLPR